MTHRTILVNTWAGPLSRVLAAGFCLAGLLGAPAGAAGLPQTAGGEFEHEVAAGDTVISIAERYLTEPKQYVRLIALNRIANARALRPGSRIRIPVAWMRGDAQPATVTAVQGRAVVARAAGSAAAAVGGVVSEGDRIVTQADGYVTLKLADGSTLRVTPQSEIEIVRARQIERTGLFFNALRAMSGKLEAVVNKLKGPSEFAVITPTANMGVRGTEFRAAYDPVKGISRTEVTEGLVALSGVNPAVRADAVALAAGSGSIVDAAGRPAAAIALLPAPIPEAQALLQERPLVRVRFPGVSGAEAYRVQLAVTRDFDLVLADRLETGPEARFTELPDGAYFLRLRAIDRHGLEGRDGVYAMQLKARPEPPITTSPRHQGKVRDAAVSFEWASGADEVSYAFQLASDALFRNIVKSESSLKTARIEAQNLSLGDYFWRVATIKGDKDRGPWGDVQRFGLLAPPATPEPPSDDDRQLTFRWSGESGQTFRFELASDSQFKSVTSAVDVRAPEAAIPRPAPGVYFVRIRATDADGFVGPFSAAQRITVLNQLADGGGARVSTQGGVPVRVD